MARITLDSGAGAVTAGDAWLYVVTGDDTILHSQAVTIA